MPRTKRQHSRIGIYHVIIRGVNKCPIFIDSSDKKRFLNTMRRFLPDTQGHLYSWCLMDNHVHLLLHMPLEELSRFMKRVEVSYVAYFNRRHRRIGHLFQDRYKSKPVNTTAYFLAVLRYIHQNPRKAGLSASCRYRWSSYNDYMGRPSSLTSTSFAMSLFTSVQDFASYHNQTDGARFMQAFSARKWVSDENAAADLQELLMSKFGLRDMGKASERVRSFILRTLKHTGYPIRQICRITGIKRRTVQQA